MGKPKDAWDFPEKWSVVRREVFKIHPLYRQEYEAAFQDYINSLPSDLAVKPKANLKEFFLFSPQAQELCQRWGLNLALHPDDKEWDTASEVTPLLFASPGRAVKLIPFGPIRANPPPPEILRDLKDIKDITPAMVKGIDPSLVDLTPVLRESRFLYIEIDLFSSMGQIEAEIKNAVGFFQEEIRRTPKFEAGPQTIESQIPFEYFEPLWWLRKPQGGLPQKVSKKPGRGPSMDIYLDEKPGLGPVTIFQVWEMNKKESKSPWKITQELYARLKTLTVKGCTRKECPKRLEFRNLSKQEKGLYSNKSCGKKESCLIAQALLKNVRDAIA